jgi:hypothetical protein
MALIALEAAYHSNKTRTLSRRLQVLYSIPELRADASFFRNVRKWRKADMARRSAAAVRRRRTDEDGSSAAPDMPLFGTLGDSTVSEFGEATELRVIGDVSSSDHRDALTKYGGAARLEGAAAPAKKRQDRPSRTAIAEELPTPIASGIGEGRRALKNGFRGMETLATEAGDPVRKKREEPQETVFRERLPTSGVSGPVIGKVHPAPANAASSAEIIAGKALFADQKRRGRPRRVDKPADPTGSVAPSAADAGPGADGSPPDVQSIVDTAAVSAAKAPGRSRRQRDQEMLLSSGAISAGSDGVEAKAPHLVSLSGSTGADDGPSHREPGSKPRICPAGEQETSVSGFSNDVDPELVHPADDVPADAGVKEDVPYRTRTAKRSLRTGDEDASPSEKDDRDVVASRGMYLRPEARKRGEDVSPYWMPLPKAIEVKSARLREEHGYHEAIGWVARIGDVCVALRWTEDGAREIGRMATFHEALAAIPEPSLFKASEAAMETAQQGRRKRKAT